MSAPIQPGRRERILCYDVIRVFSCFCVLTVHFNAAVSGFNGTFVYPNSILPNYFLGGALYLGDIGVSLFFMLSGATLMLTYRSARSFYKKRFLGIYPLFWLAFLFASAYDFLELKGMSSASPWLLLPSIAGLDGYLCTLGIIGFDFYKVGEWFLGCILLLYLIFPVLHWGIRKHPVMTVILGLAVYALGVGRFHPITFFLRIPEMLFGMLVSHYHMEKRPGVLLGICGGVFLAAWFLRSWLQPLTFTISACALIFAVLVWLSRFLKGENRLLAQAAELTYPIFLVHHWLVGKLVSGFYLPELGFRNVLGLFLIYLLLTVILSKLLMLCGDWVTGMLSSWRKERFGSLKAEK